MKMSAGYTKAGQGSKVDVTADKWPGANVTGSRLNAGSDKNWKGKRGSKKKGYRTAVG